ncbi:MAG: hypothetical protein IJ623_06470 [Bacteroidales bacterium]|nr:hypothetical protein [Bacteroidales bacterium]
MKKIICPMLAAVLLLSCGKQEPFHVSEPASTSDPWTVVTCQGELGPMGAPSTLVAGFETKAGVSLNGAGTYASCFWQSGDSFNMLAVRSDHYYQWVPYQTSEEGAKVEFTTNYSFSDDYKGNGYYSISPADAFKALGIYNSTETAFRLLVPTEQSATPGSPDPQAMVAMAKTVEQTDSPAFNNVVSLLKFRLSGALVDKLQSIKFTGTRNLAGTLPVIIDADNLPQILTGVSWSGDVLSRSVTLSGSFQPDTDYYLALAPSSQEGFTMVFTCEGGSVTKTSAKTLTLNRSRITDFGTINIGDTYDPVEAPLTPYMQASVAGAKPVTMVVLPDGYVESELDQFELDAKAGIDALFSTEPFKTYRNFFTVWILRVASNESGVNITDGNGTITTPRDCYFKSMWGESTYNDMSADDEKVFAYVEDHCPDIMDGSHTIAEVPVLIIANDSRYGGISRNWNSGKTYCITSKANGKSLSWRYASKGFEAVSATAVPPAVKEVTDAERELQGLNNGDWKNVLVHEFGGHSFAKFMDEYWYEDYGSPVSAISQHSNSVPFGLNISASGSVTPWDELLSNSSTLLAKSSLYSRVGVYQGGAVCMFYRWRSEPISCMIDNRFYFSAWQRWLIVNRIMKLAGGEAYTLAEFLASDVPDDPLRDGPITLPAPMPEGVSDIVPPYPMTMVPPVLEDF